MRLAGWYNRAVDFQIPGSLEVRDDGAPPALSAPEAAVAAVMLVVHLGVPEVSAGPRVGGLTRSARAASM
jgi:hypothetical protein